MVKVFYHYKKNNISDVSITGHANFAMQGTDIVCAAISGVVVGALNALQEMTNKTVAVISHKEGKVELKIKTTTNDNQIILKTMLWQLKTIGDKYPNYIEIKITEEV